MCISSFFELWLNLWKEISLTDFIHNPDFLIGYVADTLFICAAYKAGHCEGMLDAELLGVWLSV